MLTLQNNGARVRLTRPGLRYVIHGEHVSGSTQEFTVVLPAERSHEDAVAFARRTLKTISRR